MSNPQELEREKSQLKEMSQSFFIKAACGDIKLFEEGHNMEDFSSRTKQGSSILHIAIQNGQTKFAVEALKRYPTLILTRDLSGDNPLHIAARYGNLTGKKVVHCCTANVKKIKELSTVSNCWPWNTVNLLGYTPLYEALRTGNLDIALDMCKLTGYIWNSWDDNTETPLHMLARYAPNSANFKSIEELVEQFEWAVFKRDSDGLTPLMRAAKCGSVNVAFLIAAYHRACIEVCDSNSKTFLHYLRLQSAILTKEHNIMWICKEMLELQGVLTLLYSRNCDGNTPIHLVIIEQDFEITTIFIKQHHDMEKPNTRKLLMNFRDNKGNSIVDLITSCSKVPPNLRQIIKQVFTEGVLDKTFVDAARKGEVGLFKKRRSMNSLTSANEDIEQVDEDVNDDSYYSDEYFLGQAEDGSNILHIAIRGGHINFIKEALKSFPDLILQKDSNGDSPVHIAARLQTPASLTFFELSSTLWREWYNDENKIVHHPAPWMIKNSSGNALLHEAARYSNYNVLSLIWENESVTAAQVVDVNDHGETPLHVLARYATYSVTDNIDIVVEKLIANGESAAYMRDADDLTPLLRAAYSSRIRMISYILQYHPRSLEVCDKKGRTLLHHLRSAAVELVDDSTEPLHIWQYVFAGHPRVKELRSAQDDDGNTPLHLAILNGDIAAAKFLVEKCFADNRQELTIFNNDGYSVYDLLSSQFRNADKEGGEESVKLRNEYYVLKEMLIAVKADKLMDEKLYNAAKEGNSSILDADYDQSLCSNLARTTDLESGGINLKYEDAFFLTHTSDGGNIIHLALRFSQGKEDSPAHDKFLEKALDRFPCLLLEPDNEGDTPLHLAAKISGFVSFNLLVGRVVNDWNKLVDDHSKDYIRSPWTTRNSRGNMPIHEAMQHGNEIAFTYILDVYERAALLLNDLGETPLHVYARYGTRCFDIEDNEVDVVDKVKNKYPLVFYRRDSEGLTPLLRAAKCGNYHVVQHILQHCPQSAHLYDRKGRTFLHLLRFTSRATISEDTADYIFEWMGNKLFEIPEANKQRFVQDYDGNTPLHYAIKTKNFILAEILTKKSLNSESHPDFEVVNNDGETISNLLASHEVPHEIVQHLRKKMPQFMYMSGRTSYGVHASEVKDSVSSLSIIAGLLAAITFAAALQVPGGFNQDKGFPILSKKVAFQVFMVSDVFAVCGSMIVLFSLLWVMSCGKIYDSLVLLDLSMILLQASFYATLLAFMTGVYGTTAQQSLWLAIFVCALCSIVIVFSWRTVILSLIKFIRLLIDMYFTVGGFSFKKYRKQIGKSLGIKDD